jgi:hypothetical protein
MRRAETDIAILIPTESIEMTEYASWITDVFGRRIWESNLNVLQQLRTTLGNFDNVSTRVVGFGGFGCKKYTLDDDGNDDCKRDGKRRYAEAPLVSSVVAYGATAEVPKVWCSGNGIEGVNPVRRGDSGGPFFVRGVDHQWYYVGNIAASLRGEFGCSSSLTSSIDLWKEALASPEYKNRPRHSDDWFRKRTELAIHQFFRLLSSSPEEAQSRLLPMYYGVDRDENGNVVNVGGIDYRGVTNIKNYNEMKKIIEKWPQREFKVDTIDIEEAPILARRRAGNLSFGDRCVFLVDLEFGDWRKKTRAIAF